MRWYAGIGSRETPPITLIMMTKAAFYLDKEGYGLRSGGARGADATFERSHKGEKQIFLPWKGFNNNLSPLFGVCEEALEIAAAHHPNWGGLSGAARDLIARNTYQVLGPSREAEKSKMTQHPEQWTEFVVCWTPRGLGGGGTGQALRIARTFKIPVYDLGKDGEFNRLSEERLGLL